jgi:uncharacterized SAM-binding protein YcdF (DUF218 family)
MAVAFDHGDDEYTGTAVRFGSSLGKGRICSGGSRKVAMTFVISKLFWILAAPGNLLVLALCGSAFMLFTRWRRFGRWVVAVIAAAALVVAIVPVGQWLLIPLEERFPAAPIPEKLDGVVVLGGGISARLLEARGQASLNEHAERLFALAGFARRFPETTLIYTGGDNALVDPTNPEADAARRLMAELGLDTDQIIFERDSRNTYENALYSKALANPSPGETWLLVTSAFHMPRSVGIFRQQGWPVVPYPVDYMTDGEYRLFRSPDLTAGLTALSIGAREWIGLVAYYWLGYTDSLFPGANP